MPSHLFETKLAAFQPPLGPQPANAHFYAAQQVTLQMKEKVFSLSGDDFAVKTVEGLEVCKCKGKVLSFHDKKEFTDMAGKDLFTLRDKKLALFKSFIAESHEGYGFEIKGHFAVGKSHSTCEFKNFADGQHVELEIHGDWFDRSAKIEFGGRTVAHISRSFFNAREIFGDKQTVRLPDLELLSGICS